MTPHTRYKDLYTIYARPFFAGNWDSIGSHCCQPSPQNRKWCLRSVTLWDSFTIQIMVDFLKNTHIKRKRVNLSFHINFIGKSIRFHIKITVLKNPKSCIFLVDGGNFRPLPPPTTRMGLAIALWVSCKTYLDISDYSSSPHLVC